MTGKTEETCALAGAYAYFKVAHIVVRSDQEKTMNANWSMLPDRCRLIDADRRHELIAINL